MKKPILFAALLSLFVNANAFAKTQGNYIGLDVIKSKSSHTGKENISYTIGNDNSQSFALNYKYAFNFDDFIIAPEVFYDNLDLEMTDSIGDKWQINKRSGVKLNLGYDITDKFAVLANIGYARTIYDVEWNSVNAYKKNYSSDGSIYGISIKYSVLENLDLALGYDVSKVIMEEPNLIFNNTLFPGREIEFDVKTTRLGIAYKF